MGNVYNEPGSTGKHIFHANNTRADLTTNLGKCQIAIETDTLLIGYKDHLGNYHTVGEKISPHYRYAEEAVTGNLIIEYSADGSTGWVRAATVVEL